MILTILILSTLVTIVMLALIVCIAMIVIEPNGVALIKKYRSKLSSDATTHHLLPDTKQT